MQISLVYLLFACALVLTIVFSIQECATCAENCILDPGLCIYIYIYIPYIYIYIYIFGIDVENLDFEVFANCLGVQIGGRLLPRQLRATLLRL